MEALMMAIVCLAAMGMAVFFSLLMLALMMRQQPVQAAPRPGTLKEGLLGLVRFGWLPERLAGRALQQAETNGFERVWTMSAAGLIFVVLMSTQLTQAVQVAA